MIVKLRLKIIYEKNKIKRKYISYIQKKKNALLITGDGERYDPDLTLWKDLNHLKRYQFASGFVQKEDTVIDIACGTGYGTKILGKKAKNVYGVDISQIAIDYAKKKYQLKNISYILSNFWDFDIKANIIVSFETLEHIPNETGIIAIFNKLLDLSDKYVIASVPYKEKEGNNPHHIHFNLDENSFFFNNSNFKLDFFYQKSDGTIISNKNINDSYQNLIILVSK